MNDLDLSGDVLEISGDHSHNNNDVNELELSGNVLEKSGDHSHGNNVENLEGDSLHRQITHCLIAHYQSPHHRTVLCRQLPHNRS